MEFTTFIRNLAKNPVSTILLLIMAVIVSLSVIGDIKGMQGATTNYEYCQNLCYLVENISRTYFCCIFLLMAYLTYINKQYSKWCIWLFYLLGISALVYFLVAVRIYDHVFNLVESNYMKKLPSMAGTLFVGPVNWIIIGYLFVPRILKDAQKLKEEQDLTI